MPTRFPVRRPSGPIYYGWYIVGAAVVAQFLAVGSQAYSSGVFLKPMTEDLGWSRESYSLVQTISTFVGGVSGFAIGGMIDRRGARPLMLVGGAVAGAALILTSQVHEIWQFYLTRGIAGTLGTALLGNIVVNVTLSKWFVLRRGLAIAIAATGTSLSGVIMAPAVAWCIEIYDWRTAWFALGCVVWVSSIPTAMVMRRTPEDIGLQPDGMSASQSAAYASAHRRASASSERSWTRPEAVRTKTIWLLTLSYGVANIGVGAILLHLIPFLTDHGFGRGRAALMFSTISWASLLAKPVWGVLMDRYHARYLSSVGFALAAIGLVALVPAVTGGAPALVIVAVLLLYGISIGGIIPLQETVWASYFGRAHLGKIRSIAMPFTIVFGAGGPLLAGAIYDRTGEYSIAFLCFAGFSIAGSALILLSRPPQYPSQSEPLESADIAPLPARV